MKVLELGEIVATHKPTKLYISLKPGLTKETTDLNMENLRPVAQYAHGFHNGHPILVFEWDENEDNHKEKKDEQ